MNGRHRHDPKGHITVETKSSRLFRLCRMAQPVIFAVLTLAPVFASRSPATAQTQAKPPNIVVIWGDDIGYWNVSAYNQGMMGYRTPNIDRIAREGALFTD
jgi:hypothetical protein